MHKSEMRKSRYNTRVPHYGKSRNRGKSFDGWRPPPRKARNTTFSGIKPYVSWPIFDIWENKIEKSIKQLVKARKNMETILIVASNSTPPKYEVGYDLGDINKDITTMIVVSDFGEISMKEYEELIITGQIIKQLPTWNNKDGRQSSADNDQSLPYGEGMRRLPESLGLEIKLPENQSE